MKFKKTKYKKSHYKNTNAYLEAVYYQNKDVINKALSDVVSKHYKSTFKQMVNEYVAEGRSVDKALKTIGSSSIFSTKFERHRDRIHENLTSDRQAYRIFRELTKEKGRYTKFDPLEFKWDRRSQSYIYKSSVAISFRNSPYGIEVWKI